MTEREALIALATPEPDEPLYDNPDATRRKDEWNARRIEALRLARSLTRA